jgi:hypothetical protein
MNDCAEPGSGSDYRNNRPGICASADFIAAFSVAHHLSGMVPLV